MVGYGTTAAGARRRGRSEEGIGVTVADARSQPLDAGLLARSRRNTTCW